jgi:glycosyltransferase involved in cell wall biosynthesis
MISIAMATYNGAQHIREQIDSILNQTIQDFELVICDDCSQDDTLSIIKHYAEQDKRIHVYENENNIGYKQNFEKVISYCNGKYIALSDQDDIWMPNHIEVLQEGMAKNVQIVCGRPLFVDENNIELTKEYDYFSMDCIPYNNEDVARHILLDSNTYQGASMLIRKEFFEKALPIPEDANYHDNWFAILSCFIGGIVYKDTIITRYRRYNNSVTIKRKRVRNIKKMIGVTLNNHYSQERICFIDAICQKLSSLTPAQKILLNDCRKIIMRRKTIVGRIQNIPYLIRHYKSIYASDFQHLFRL